MIGDKWKVDYNKQTKYSKASQIRIRLRSKEGNEVPWSVQDTSNTNDFLRRGP